MLNKDENERDDNSTTTKYIIKARFEVDGVVEKPDVIGAIFGQTEGLLGDDLDLRELQKTGRIGRIDISIQSKNGKTTGTIIVPSSLDRVETAILAASLEIVDRVGPCTARMFFDENSIQDVRETKRKQIISKASTILKHWNETVSPESQEIADEVIKQVRVAPISKYGPESLPAGPDIENKDLILVEGRADILNLLKCDIKNVVAVEGTKVPRSIGELTKKKETVTAFLDGDRGGDMILRELLQIAKIDFVARAPAGREVEDLTRKEILKALSEKLPIDQVLKKGEKESRKMPASRPPGRREMKPRKAPQKESAPAEVKPPQPVEKPPTSAPVKPAPASTRRVDVPQEIVTAIQQLKDDESKMQALLLDSSYKIIKKIEVRALASELSEQKDVFAVIFDGVITQRILDVAGGSIRYIIGQRVGGITKKPSQIRIHTISELQ